MRVVLYNLQYGAAAEGPLSYLKPAGSRRRLQNLQAIIEGLRTLEPDVLGMIEADAGSWRMAGIDMAQEVAKALGMPHLDEDCKYPHPVDRVPIMSYNVAALASREPLVDPRSLELSVGFKRRALRASTGGVTYIVVHLSLLARSRRRQVMDLVRFAIETDGPLVIMGDLNALPDSPELEVLVNETGLTRVPLGETFPSWKPVKALDHFFVSPHIEVTDAYVPDMKLSDHRPILMEFELRTV